MRSPKSQLTVFSVFAASVIMAAGCIPNSSSERQTKIRTGTRGAPGSGADAMAAGRGTGANGKLTGAVTPVSYGVESDAEFDLQLKLSLKGDVVKIEDLEVGSYQLSQVHHILVSQSGAVQARTREILAFNVNDQGLATLAGLQGGRTKADATKLKTSQFDTNVPVVFEVKSGTPRFDVASSLKLSLRQEAKTSSVGIDSPDQALRGFFDRFGAEGLTLTQNGIYVGGPKDSEHFFTLRKSGDQLVLVEEANSLKTAGRYRTLALWFKKMVTPAAATSPAAAPPAASAAPAPAASPAPAERATPATPASPAPATPAAPPAAAGETE